MLRFSRKKRWLILPVLIFAITLSSCDTKPTPPSDEVHVGAMIKVNGRVYGEVRSHQATADGIGEISGGGSYFHGERVTIEARIYPESKYRLYALYEKEGKGGFTKEQGLINETTTIGGYKKVKDTSCMITMTVTEDMTFIAQFISKEGEIEEDESITIGSVDVKTTEKDPNVINVDATEGNMS